MKQIYICRAIPVDQDSRVQRFREILNSQNNEINIIQWGGTKSSGVIVSPVPRIRGNRALNLILTPIFSIWLLLYLLIKAPKNSLVIAIDLDTAFPSYIGSIFKNYKYIFDIADPYALCRLNQSNKIIDWIEGFVAKKATLALIPSKCRSSFYPQKIDFCIIENVPSLKEFSVSGPSTDNGVLNVGYFGNLEPLHRGLELLTSTVLSRSDIFLHVGGGGGLQEFFQKTSLQNPDKIKFHGKFAPSNLTEMASKCHLMFAFYSLTKEHHKYVAANKLYEHLFLALPILTNTGTNFSQDILDWGTGWQIEESESSINAFLDYLKIHKDVALEKSENARKIWNQNFSNYWQKSPEVCRFLRTIRSN